MKLKDFGLAFLLICTLQLSATLTANAQGSIPFPAKAYQATYLEKMSTGTDSIRKFASDGKGKGWSQVSRQGGKTYTSILDYPAGLCHIIMEGQSVMSIPIGAEDVIAMGNASKKMYSKTTPLGKKIIAGHPCTGTHNIGQDITCDIWMGDDIGIIVMSETYTKMGKHTSILQSYQGGQPPATLFQVPAMKVNFKL